MTVLCCHVRNKKRPKCGALKDAPEGVVAFREQKPLTMTCEAIAAQIHLIVLNSLHRLSIRRVDFPVGGLGHERAAEVCAWC